MSKAKPINGFKIERGVLMPSRRSTESKYPFLELEIGDSFFVPEDANKDNNIRASAHSVGFRNSKKFSVRKVDGGFRVWRTS